MNWQSFIYGAALATSVCLITAWLRSDNDTIENTEKITEVQGLRDLVQEVDLKLDTVLQRIDAIVVANKSDIYRQLSTEQAIDALLVGIADEITPSDTAKSDSIAADKKEENLGSQIEIESNEEIEAVEIQ